MNPHFPKSVAALKEREERCRAKVEKEWNRTKPMDFFGPILAVISMQNIIVMAM